MSREHTVATTTVVIAGCGAVVSVFGPHELFVWFRDHVVGTPHPDTSPFALDDTQRAIAVLGALLAGVVLWRVARLPVVEHPRLCGWGLALVVVPFVGTVFFNLRWAGVQQGLWGFWWPQVARAYFPVVAAFGAAALVVNGVAPWRRLDENALHGAALGIGYGAFSSLWHCCAPIAANPVEVLGLIALAVWGIAFASFVAAMGTRFSYPWGEVVGATTFAVGYPWHTPLWFVQGLLGGVLTVWLARRSRSILSPGFFLASAYVTHTTLPFLFASSD